MATINKTRPSCARVKVQVDLLSNLPKIVRMEIQNEVTGKICTEEIKIQNDYLPKYCQECSLEGHNVDECRLLHPELTVEAPRETFNVDQQQSQRTTFTSRMLNSGKTVGSLEVSLAVTEDNMENGVEHPLTVKNQSEHHI